MSKEKKLLLKNLMLKTIMLRNGIGAEMRIYTSLAFVGNYIKDAS